MKTAKIRLYVNTDLAPGQSVALSREQSNYLFAVMRLEVGAGVGLFNGRDGEFLGRVAVANKKNGILVCEDQIAPLVMPPDVWLLFAPVKKDRTAFIVEKAVELGARRMCPVLTDFTNAERLRLDKLNAYALEAAEQSGATFVPQVAAPENLRDLLAGWPSGRAIYFCDETCAGQPSGVLAPNSVSGSAPPDQASAILIGPEGGFSDSEREVLRSHKDTRAMSLGPRILRAETAAIAALTLWQAAAGDWS